MKIVIRKNNHYPFPCIPIGWPLFINSITTREASFKFTNSCMYNLHDNDQHDINKLFGFSIGKHHLNSFRFGWRPILEENKIEIVSYEYQNGVRKKAYTLCRINVNDTIKLTVTYNKKGECITYNATVNGVNYTHFSYSVIKSSSFIGYTLGLYFGGNKRAPHDIIIYKCS